MLQRHEKKLNLGSGWYPKQGFVNVDCDPRYPADVIHDLEKTPWPFEDNQFELIEADHVLEHLGEIRAVMSELHRILRPGGILRIRVPHSSRGFTHWDHKRGFDVSFPMYFSTDIS